MLGSKYLSKRNRYAARLQVEQLEVREVLSSTTPSTPLNDLGTGLYKKQQGGLYPSGMDVRPAALETAAETRAAQIVPLDANGNVDQTNGKIVLLSVGMSNASSEFDGDSGAFKPIADADPSKNSKLVIVNGAQDGKDATDWADPNNSAWTTALDRLASAGVTANQVQVVWLKEAERDPSQYGGFVPAAQKLQSDLESIARNIKTYFPNAQITYLSSRTHAFTTTGLNPEPYAFESGFAVKWTIQDQINGKGNLNWDPSKGAVVAPLLSWGSYLWANGTTARSDGFTWTQADVTSDNTHPSASGIAKVANMLLAFFKTDPTTTPWFLRATPAGAGPTVTASADKTSGSSGLTVNFTASATAGGGASISQYAWTYDDGDFAYGTNPTKIFYAPGTYHVHLAVTDSNGNVTLNTIAITVSKGSGPAPAPATGSSDSSTQPAAPAPLALPEWANLPGPGGANNGRSHPVAPGEWTFAGVRPDPHESRGLLVTHSLEGHSPASTTSAELHARPAARLLHPGAAVLHEEPWLPAFSAVLDPARQLN